MAPSSSSFERPLAVQLILVGNGLLNAPSCVDELLALLNDAEDLLANMEQGQSIPRLDSLLPVMKALISDSLLKHSVEGVRMSVTYCLTELMRITAPEEPFNDDQMKVIFQLIVEAFSKLSEVSTPYYEKALSILETFSRVKACLLMLDLNCDALVVQMFQNFWAFVRSDPTDDVLWAVEQIMTDILSESEDISSGLLSPLLASVLKGNENAAPSCWKLGERVISSCAAKLGPVILGATQLNGTTVDDYSPVVASICENEPPTMENNHANGSSQPVRPKEGYNLSWLNRESQTKKQPQNRRISVNRGNLTHTKKKPQNRRISVNRSNLTAVATVSTRKRRTALKSNVDSERDEAAVVFSDLRHKRMKLPTKGGCNTSRGTLEESGVLAGVLVGRQIKVWWPLDEMFYDGLIQSYDRITKKHKVLYGDGDEETLNLEEERWEFIEDKFPDEEADNPKPITSPVFLTKQSGNDKSSQSIKILNCKQIIKRAGAAARLPEVEASNLSNRNIGGDESSDDDSNDGNVFEIRARSKDVQLENLSGNTSDNSTPEASPPRAIRFRSKEVQLEHPITSTSNESTPEGSPLRYMRNKSTDVRLQSSSDDSTPEASLSRARGLWRSRSRHH